MLNDFGALHEGRGLYAEALKAYQEALRVRRDLGDDRQLAQSYDNVGYIYYLQGEYDHARVYWKQALDLHRKAGEKGGIVLSTQNLGFLHTAQGRWDEAFALLRRCAGGGPRDRLQGTPWRSPSATWACCTATRDATPPRRRRSRRRARSWRSWGTSAG